MFSNQRVPGAGFLALAALLSLASATIAGAQSLAVGDFQKVSEVRITRTVSEFTYRASLTNSGPAIPGAVATVTSLSAATQIVEGTLTFGPVGANATVPTLDTFTFRHNRTLPFDWAVLQWVVTADTVNQPPVADAGPDQTVASGALVALDGSGSNDADGDPLGFSWSLTSVPQGSGAALSDPTAMNPTFVADLPGTYVARLIVNDGVSDSAPDEVVVSTLNSAPVANAGTDQTAILGATVTLDGSGSTDADGDPLTFSWTIVSRPDTSAAVLDDPAAVRPTLTVDLPGTYVIQLIVHDGTVASDPDTVTVSTINSPPIADAGSDQTVTVGAVVTVDGGGSSDPDGDALSFSWSFTTRPDGSGAALTDASAVAPSFTADVPGTYVLQLIVNDGTVDSAPDVVVITTENSAPIADAGPDQTVPTGAVVDLDGSASHDPDGTPLLFSWSFTSVPAGSTAALDDSTSATPSFVADLAGSYVAQLIVNDGFAASEPDTVTITATPPPLPFVSVVATDPEASESSGEPGIFTITRFGTTSSDLVVFYTMTGTATNGADYQALSGSVTIPGGSGSATVVVSPLDDLLFEPPERAILQLTPDPSYDITLDQAAVTIVDDELPAVTIVASDDTAAEAGLETGSFTIERTGPTSAALMVFYNIFGGATNGSDYETLSGSVTIPAGSATATIPIVPIDDSVFEDPESVILSLEANTAYQVVTPGIASVLIVDNDGAVVTIVATDPNASEPGLDPGEFTVTRTGGELTAALLLIISRSGTADNGSDYASLGGASFALTIPANETTAIITITPLPDTIAEGDETVILTISPRTVYTIGTPGSATVVIAGP